MTKLLLRIGAALIGLLIALFCLDRAAHGQMTIRFHRYALTPIDMSAEVRGVVDLVKDAATGKCWAVYVLVVPGSYRAPATVAATTLGETACVPNPIGVK